MIVQTRLTKDLAERFKYIRDKYGFTSVEDVLNYCLSYTYVREQISVVVPHEGVTKEEVEKSKNVELATLPYPNGLAGTIFTKTGGGRWVKYYTYFNRDRMEAELPLEDVSKEIIDNQYIPSYEEIKSMQERGKVSY